MVSRAHRQQMSYYVIFLYLLPFYLPRFSLHILLIVLFFCRNCEEYRSCEKITVRVNTSNTGLASSSQHAVERKLGNPSGHVTISKYWKFFFLVIYQTWEKVFNNISKHLEERWKTDAKQRTFENKEMFGNFDETLSHVFFICICLLDVENKTKRLSDKYNHKTPR